MYLVFSFYCLFLLSVLLASLRKPSPRGRFKRFDFVGIFFPLVITIAFTFRDLTVGIDTTAHYLPIYSKLNQLQDVLIIPQSYFSYDSQLYWFFLYLCRLVGLDFQGLMLVHGVSLVVLLWWLAKVVGGSFSYFAATYMATLLYLMSTANTLRQGVAVIFVLLFVAYLHRNKLKVAGAVGIAAIFIHGSAILMVSLSVMARYALTVIDSSHKSGSKVLPFVVYSVLCLIIYFGFSSLFEESFNKKFEFYYVSGFSFSERSSLERPWVILSLVSLFPMLFLLLKKEIAKRVLRGGYDLVMYWIRIYISFVIFWLLFLNIPGVFERLGDYIAGVQVVLVALIFGNIWRNSLPAQFIYFLLCLLLGWMNYFSDSAKLVIGM